MKMINPYTLSLPYMNYNCYVGALKKKRSNTERPTVIVSLFSNMKTHLDNRYFNVNVHWYLFELHFFRFGLE